MRFGASASVQMMKASTKSSPNTSNNLINIYVSFSLQLRFQRPKTNINITVYTLLCNHPLHKAKFCSSAFRIKIDFFVTKLVYFLSY